MIKRRMLKGNIIYLISVLLIFIIFIIFIGLYIIKRGAIYSPVRLDLCKNKENKDFCGIKEINLSIPENLKQEILEKTADLDSGKRIVLPGWKAGRTITTQEVIHTLPNVWEWYKSLVSKIRSEIGTQVKTTQDFLPTSCAVLIYENNGDFINWHYDVNYFNGQSFTLLVPLTFTDVCTEYIYKDPYGKQRSLPNTEGKSILFEGEKVFHMASPFCKCGAKQKRVVLSMQFSTDPTISWYNRALMRLKDIAYIGI